MKREVTILAALIGGMSLGFVSGCEEKGPMEKAGEKTDDAAKEAGDAAKKAGEDAKKATEGSGG